MEDVGLLNADALARITKLELIARQTVEGFLSGLHHSPYHGSSVEYLDHRPYTIGDQIRTIDWKLLAKTDKYYVKLFEEETNLRGTVLLDASASMNYTADGRPTKLAYGRMLAAALSYLMVHQNDAAGLVVFDNAVRSYLPSRATPQHFRLIAERLEEVEPGSETKLGPVLHEIAGRLRRRGLIILISDLLDEADEIKNGLTHFRHNHNDVIVFHLVDPDELSFPFTRLTRFKDMEGTGSFVANPASIRRKYLERMHSFMA
ncbi:MAG: DUF58 domain-containing protein, partial [Lentisphaerae bacterium]|nr:DUF58 domain-containing protein [Lentisphaerota bacterium]